jgi:hypothetical protein
MMFVGHKECCGVGCKMCTQFYSECLKSRDSSTSTPPPSAGSILTFFIDSLDGLGNSEAQSSTAGAREKFRGLGMLIHV